MNNIILFKSNLWFLPWERLRKTDEGQEFPHTPQKLQPAKVSRSTDFGKYSGRKCFLNLGISKTSMRGMIERQENGADY